jgi:hypothetical protein
MFDNAKTSFRSLRAIASTTAAELSGQPAVLLLTLVGVVATALIPFLQLHSFGEAGRLARDGGLAYQLVIGLALAVVSASSSIFDEVAGGTASAALAKPVSRELFLVGKWFGVMAVTTRFWFSMLSTTMIAERVAERLDGSDYVTDKPAQFVLFLIPILTLTVAGYLHNRRHARFCRTALVILTGFLAAALVAALLFTRTTTFSPAFNNLHLAVIPVSALILLALGTYAAIAAALATRLRAAPALIICLVLLLLGLSSDTLLGPSSPVPVRLLASLVPNLQAFWMCDSLAPGGSLPPLYLLRAALYAAAFSAVALGAAMLAFRAKDIP